MAQISFHFPSDYKLLKTTDSGNELWSVRAKANVPETPHSHVGGMLLTPEAR